LDNPSAQVFPTYVKTYATVHAINVIVIVSFKLES